MMSTAEDLECPNVAEIRAALDHVLGTRKFNACPRLASFLRFVVETTLDGQGGRLKGYTIGVEALGRDAGFDPQIDPIVRVEAGRLRRALARYYDDEGAGDPVLIELPPVGYVPKFRRCRSRPAPRLLLSRAQRALSRYRRAAWLRIAGLAVVPIKAAGHWRLRPSTVPQFVTGAVSMRPARSPAAFRRGPILQVAPVELVGTPGPDTILAAPLRERLVDAFARFDDVTVVSDLAPGAHNPDYRLSALVRHYRDRSFSLLFHLLEVADGAIVWSRSFDQLQPAGNLAAVKARVVRGVTIPLLQPFGVIYARESLNYADTGATDPYRCLLDSHDYLHGFDRAGHAAVRARLEHAIAKDPNFVCGLIQLARVYLREYQFGIDGQPGEPPALDRAFTLAERALVLKPTSAQAHFALFDLYMARGDLAAAKTEAERAVALNPYDMPGMFHYGALLVQLGEVEKGEAILHEIANESAVPPGRLDFILFVAAYLKGNLNAAGYYAKRMTGHPMPLGFLARALVAAKTGDKLAARLELQRLSARQPEWRSDPLSQLRTLFPALAVYERIATDFAAMAAAAAN